MAEGGRKPSTRGERISALVLAILLGGMAVVLYVACALPSWQSRAWAQHPGRFVGAEMFAASVATVFALMALWMLWETVR